MIENDPAIGVHALGMILANAAAAPEEPALWAEDGVAVLSRRGLADLVTQTGKALGARGAQPGDRVILVAPQGAVTAAALLALSAHVAVAPVAPGPVTDLARIVSRVKPRFLAVLGMSDPDLVACLTAAQTSVLTLLPDPARGPGWFDIAPPDRQTRGAADAAPLVLAGSQDIALILPTSGTTGEPKLVGLTHAHLGHVALSARRTLALCEHDICVNPMPLHHVHGISIGTFLPLASGGSIVALSTTSGAAVLAAAESTGATWYTAVPTIHQDVARAAAARPPDPGRLRLRFARSASSALAASTRSDLSRLLGIPVFEGLGMTEAASWVAHQPVGQTPQHGTVGQGQGIEVAVLDDGGRILHSPGNTGEMILRGPNVITHYLEEAPDDTRFVSGWLRTGDLIRMSPEGEIAVVGRLKELINRGGATIPPVAVEDALLAHPAVARAVVFGVPHTSLGQELAAAVVLETGHSSDGQAIRRWLAERVAPEQLPRSVLVVDAIPQNAVGKPERIRAAEFFRSELRADHVAPIGPLEMVVADLVAELLPGVQVGRMEDLFMAGADSLVMLRLQIRIEELFGTAPDPGEVADHFTIATLADYLGRVCDPEALTMLANLWAEVAQTPSGPAEGSQ